MRSFARQMTLIVLSLLVSGTMIFPTLEKNSAKYQDVEVKESFLIANSLNEIEKIKGEFTGLLTAQHGSLEQISSFSFYLINGEGLKKKITLPSNRIYLGECKGESYIEIVWKIKKNIKTGELILNNDYYDDVVNSFKGISQYVDYGTIEKIVIYSSIDK